MWFFRSSRVIFGEDALSWLADLTGRRAMIVTDPNMVNLGIVQEVCRYLNQAGLETRVFAEVEPDPCLETVQRCAAEMLDYSPDWVSGLGGGSSMDAAKAAWFQYERPDVSLESVSPFEEFGLRAKARFITIPTTAGSGAEVTAAAVLTDQQNCRKIEMASYELIADFAVVDPALSGDMPPALTADTGIDVLTHAVEGFSSTWANDFSDAFCLQAARMVFEFLPRAFEQGAQDPEAREKMANAATMAALGMTNSHIGLAHALGHSTGAVFRLPHGRVTGLFLPYTIEFTTNGGFGRYQELARAAGLPARDETEAGHALAQAVRKLMQRINLPLSLQEAGISSGILDAQMEMLCERVEMDLSLITSRRIPDRDEMARLFQYAFVGRPVDF